MFSLIITIVSIALVAALALATLYYGGNAFNAGAADAKAAQLLNEGQQLMAAADLYRQQTGNYPDSPQQLLDGKFLKSVPVGWVMGTSHAQVAAPDEWRIAAPKVPLFIKTETEPRVCQAVNQKTYGLNGVLQDMRSELIAQCFGPKNTFTVAVSKGAATFVGMPATTTLPFTPSTAPIPDATDTDAWEIPPGTVAEGASPSTPTDPFEPPAPAPGRLTLTPYYFPDGYSHPNWGTVATDRADREGGFEFVFIDGAYSYRALNDSSDLDYFLVQNQTEGPITLEHSGSSLYGKYEGAPEDLGRGFPFCDLAANQVLEPGQGCVVTASRYYDCIDSGTAPVRSEQLSELTRMNVVLTEFACAPDVPDPEPGFLEIDPGGLFDTGYVAPGSNSIQTVTLSNPEWTTSSVDVVSVFIQTDQGNVEYVSDTCVGWDIDPEGVDGARTPLVLTPGESCEMTFRLTAPPGETDSFDFGTVYFDFENEEYTDSRTLIFRGSTVPSAPEQPTLVLGPSGDPWNVGFVGLGNGALVQNSVWVNVKNIGQSPLTISELQLAPGPHGTVQIIDQQNCLGSPPYTLSQDQECVFRVAGVAPTDLQFPYTPNANFGTFRVISNTEGNPANETVIVGRTGNVLFMPTNPAVLENGTEPNATPRAYNKLAVDIPTYIDLRRYLGAYLVSPANESIITQESRLDTGTVAPGYLSWSFPSGSLPAGLSFDPSTAVISGTPTVAVTNLDLPFTVTYNSFAETGSEGIGQVSGSFNLTVLPRPYVDMNVQSVPASDDTPDGRLIASFSGPLMETWNGTRYQLDGFCQLTVFSARGGPPYGGDTRYYLERSFGLPLVELDSPRPVNYNWVTDPVFDPPVTGAYRVGMSSFEGEQPAGTWEGSNFMSCTDGAVTLSMPVFFPNTTPRNSAGTTFTPPAIPSGGSTCMRFGPAGEYLGTCP